MKTYHPWPVGRLERFPAGHVFLSSEVRCKQRTLEVRMVLSSVLQRVIYMKLGILVFAVALLSGCGVQFGVEWNGKTSKDDRRFTSEATPVKDTGWFW